MSMQRVLAAMSSLRWVPKAHPGSSFAVGQVQLTLAFSAAGDVCSVWHRCPADAGSLVGYACYFVFQLALATQCSTAAQRALGHTRLTIVWLLWYMRHNFTCAALRAVEAPCVA